MKEKKFIVELPTEQYYEEEVKCRTGCPVNTDARGYLLATEKGKYKEAYAISRATNPFASICGKVCGAPCETACRRSDVDETLTIRNIKGFLTDKHGPETGDLKTPLTYSKVQGEIGAKSNGKSVGIIGGGVAGYTCAHDLARLGYKSTIYEKHHVSGGMLIQGVPINRLSRQVIQAEIDSILELGLIEIKHNMEVGKNIQFEEICEAHDAVFIGTGLCVGKILPMENSDNEDVHSGLAFLLDFNFEKAWDLKEKRSIVIGGGDVACDVARSALRCGSPKVHMCCVEREHLGEMTSSFDEREGARREGVIIRDGWGPNEIVVEDGKFKGLKIKKIKSVFNAEGHFAPEYEDETEIIEGESLFMAVGQAGDLGFLKDANVTISSRGIIETNKETRMTSREGVFAGGDIALGPKLFIDAIADGSKAALGIDSYLSKQTLMKKKRNLTFIDYKTYKRESTYVDREWVNREELEVDVVQEPHKNSTVEYDDQTAREQCSRCLACHIHPTFEGNICILCGDCVDFCPSYCLRMVSIDRIEGDENIQKLIDGEFGKAEKLSEHSVMLFDPLKCIRCGMCAQICPTGACAMTYNEFEDTYIPCKSS